jgi:NAD-dependent SIR2 family protein deacetylase
MSKWIGPKKYATLSDEQKVYWNPAWKEYKEEKRMEMQYCDCCGHELGLEEEVTRIPIGEPYRYYEAGPMQVYFGKQFLARANDNVILNNQLNPETKGKDINFTRFSPLEGEEPKQEEQHE